MSKIHQETSQNHLCPFTLNMRLQGFGASFNQLLTATHGWLMLHGWRPGSDPWQLPAWLRSVAGESGLARES